MKMFFSIVAGVFFVLLLGVHYALTTCAAPAKDGVNGWVELYFSQARIPMFTGFITLGSFLLTLQTVIIQRLKDAFDTDDYEKRYLRLRAKEPKARYYGSLERMSTALSANVILSLSAAFTQLTVGFIRTEWSTAACIALAATSILLVGFLTLQQLLVHKEWFVHIEAVRQRQLKERSACG